MRRIGRFGLFLAGTLAVSSAATYSAPTSAAPPQSRRQTVKPLPVLGHLLMRKHRVTFKSGNRFSVYTRDGKRVAEDVSLSQLKVIEPSLYEALEPIIAGDAFVYAGK